MVSKEKKNLSKGIHWESPDLKRHGLIIILSKAKSPIHSSAIYPLSLNLFHFPRLKGSELSAFQSQVAWQTWIAHDLSAVTCMCVSVCVWVGGGSDTLIALLPFSKNVPVFFFPS